MVGKTSCRIWMVVVLGLLFGGCASISTTERSGSVDLGAPQVLAWQCPAPHRNRQVAVTAFEALKGMERVGLDTARVFAASLSASGAFGKVLLLADGEPKEEVFDAAGTDLVVRGKVERLVVGSGALSEHLDLRVWVTDVRTGNVLWWVKQSASSSPRPDLDLFWTVVPGGGAASYGRLAEALANQFAELLSDKEAHRRGCMSLDQ